MDAIYTPPELAEFLVATSSLSAPDSIADFAAGDGALLRAAAARWPKAQLFGSDIDESAIAGLGGGNLACGAELYDFLAEGSNRALDGRTFDLILLNPPFSGRGSLRHTALVAGVSLQGSKALVFVARALGFLKASGEIVSILPASVLTSERDADLLDAIRAQCQVHQVGEVRRAAFKSHTVSVVVLRMTRMENTPSSQEVKPRQVTLRPFAVEMTRGSLSVHAFEPAKTGARYVHTTHMRASRLLATQQRVSIQWRQVEGPVVLIPRVGRPTRGKVVLLSRGKAVLSDCVIALRTAPSGHERELAALLRKNWSSFANAYGGSCAPYTTLKRLRDALLRHGVLSSVTSPKPAADDVAEDGSQHVCVAAPQKIAFIG